MKIRNNFIPSTFNLFNSIPSAFLRNSLLALICSLFLFTSISSALANRQSGESHKNPAAEKLTNALGALLHQYQNARGAEKNQLLEDLMAAAARRQEILSSIIAENPGEVLRLAVPKKVKANMPEPVQAMIEEHLSVTGELEVLDEDYPDGSHRLRHFLRAGDKRYALNFKKTPKNLLTGTQVNANGVLVNGNGKSDGAIALGSDENLITLAAGGDETTTTSSVVSDDTLPNTLGEQSTVVLLVNFQDDPTNKPWTLSEVENLVFGTVNDFYVENSFGQTWLSGDVFGWYTLPVDSTSSDYHELASQADTAATASGIDLSIYQRVVYIFPVTSSFGWTGLGTLGGAPSNCWINGKLDLRIVGHELGHNFGLYHAHSLECGDTTLGSYYQAIEYGDPFDIMGSNTCHFNSFHKERLGWINDENPNEVMVVETDGMYTLEPYETSPGLEPKSLKILKSTNPDTGLRTWYYLEYRQAIGFDKWLSEGFFFDPTNMLNGVVVHTGTESMPNSSYLLDMTPNSSTYYDWFDPAIMVGSSFSDPDTGMTITTDWADSESIDVIVSTGSEAVVSSDPGLALSPAESPWVTPGTLVSYIVTVTNNDTGLNSQFDLEATAPIGWSAKFSNSSVALAPGESTSMTLEVISSPSTENGFYDIGVSVENSSDPTFNASGTVTYIVEAVASESSNSAPFAVDDSVSTSRKTSVVIDVLANDTDPDGDTLWISSVEQGRKGSVSITGSGELLYSPSPKGRGTDSFIYCVTDGTVQSTAKVSVVINK